MSSTALSESQTAEMKGAAFAARVRAVDREALEAVVRVYLGPSSPLTPDVETEIFA